MLDFFVAAAKVPKQRHNGKRGVLSRFAADALLSHSVRWRHTGRHGEKGADAVTPFPSLQRPFFVVSPHTEEGTEKPYGPFARRVWFVEKRHHHRHGLGRKQTNGIHKTIHPAERAQGRVTQQSEVFGVGPVGFAGVGFKRRGHLADVFGGKEVVELEGWESTPVI